MSFDARCFALTERGGTYTFLGVDDEKESGDRDKDERFVMVHVIHVFPHSNFLQFDACEKTQTSFVISRVFPWFARAKKKGLGYP